MSLEEALRENTAAVVEHNALLREVLGQAAKRNAAKPVSSDEDGGEEKKPTTRRRAAAKDTTEDGEEKKPAKAAKGPTVDDAKKLVSDWLNEIEVEVDDDDEPVDEENAKLMKKRNARKAFAKKALAKLEVGSVSELTEAGDIKKFCDWIEAKKGGTDPFADEE